MLERMGQEAQRSDLSRFPDVHSWDAISHFYNEAKYVTHYSSVSNAKYQFKKALKERRFFPSGCPVRLWVYVGEDGEWRLWEWIDGELVPKPVPMGENDGD